MSMWAMLASPMIVGYDLRNTSAATIKALIHPGILKISQDTLGRQATLVPPPAPPLTTKLCLGSLGVYGSDPKHLTHLVPCDHSGPHFAAAASRWAYDSTSKQLRYEGVTGQPKPAHAGVCLATPTLTTANEQQQLNTTSCAGVDSRGWEFSADGVLSVPHPDDVALSLCINVWQCELSGRVVYYPCKAVGVGECLSTNEKWSLGADGLLATALASPPPPAASTQVWHRPLAGGETAVSLLNRGNEISAKIRYARTLAVTPVCLRHTWAYYMPIHLVSPQPAFRVYSTASSSRRSGGAVARPR